MSIKVSLTLDSNEWNIEEIAQQLAITPYKIITKPPTGMPEVGTTWYTQVITDSRCIDEPLKIVKARVMPKINNLSAVCEKYKTTPVVQIIVNSDYPNRPDLTLEPSDIEFIHLIRAELTMEVNIE